MLGTVRREAGGDPGPGSDTEVLAWFRWLVNEYKPARSILRAMSWKTSLEDETAFTEADGVWLAVRPEYADRRSGAFRCMTGASGTTTAFSGRMMGGCSTTESTGTHAGSPSAICMTSGLSSSTWPCNLSWRMRCAMCRCITARCATRAKAATGRWKAPPWTICKAVWPFPAGMWRKCGKASQPPLNVTARDDVGRYHDGSITHGQRYISLRNGAFFHDGSRSRGPFGGRADFSGVRHDGAPGMTARPGIVCGVGCPRRGNAPWCSPMPRCPTCAVAVSMEGAAGMEDAFSLTEDVTVRVLRYTLHNGTAFHNSGPQYGGGKELV